MEARKLWHDPTELISRAVQPILWLGIFGEALSKVRAIPTQGFTYLQFITPGILTQSVVFVAIFYGLYIIMDRDTGILQKLLVTPTPRLALVWGKMISAGLRGLTQAVVVFIFALILGVQLHISLLTILGVILIVMLGAAVFHRTFNDYRLNCKNPRAFYGNRPGYHSAFIFCFKRNISCFNNACLAASCGKC